MVTIAPHNPFIFPQTLKVPSGARPGNITQDRTARLTAPGTTHSAAGWEHNGHIERGYVLRPWSDKFQNNLIREGAIVFLNRNTGRPADSRDPRSSGQTESQPYTIVSLAQLNMLLEEGYNRGMKLLSEWYDRNQGLPGLEDTLFRFLYLPEEAHSVLFEKDGELIRDDPVFKYFYFLSKRGILERWNYLGFSRKSSAPGTRAMGITAYMPMDVIFKGPLMVQNVYGEDAAASSTAYLVLKRKFNKDTGRYGAFAFHPVSTIDQYLDDNKLAYLDTSGAAASGYQITQGVFLDSLGPAPPSNELVIAQGLDPKTTPSAEFEVTRKINYTWLMIHPRVACKYIARV
jgi:hypothetical protein